jgi:CheY-like chemotaxis protein
MTAGERPFEIHQVEDNPGDVRLTREALLEREAQPALHVAPDAEEGLAFLRRQGRHAEAPRPDLVLLDLDLPRRPGREVLSEIKQDPSLREIPVVVFTSSSAAADVRDCYERHANCYVKKPLDFEGYARALRSIEEFWFRVARLPSRE